MPCRISSRPGPDGRLHGLGLLGRHPGDEHRAVAVGEQLGDDAGALLGGLARAEDRLRHALAEGAVVIDESPADIGERQPAQPRHDLVDADPPGDDVVEHRPQRRFLHDSTLPDAGPERTDGRFRDDSVGQRRIGGS